MLDVVGSLPRMLADENITAKNRPTTKHHVRSRSLSPSRENRVIPHRSRKIDDLILDWGERERKAIEVEAEDILYNTVQKGLSSILSPRETKKPVLDSSPPTNGMSSLERQASNFDGSKTGQQHRARYHYEQQSVYNDNARPKRSHSAGRYPDHSEYRRDNYVRSDDYGHDAESRSYQHYRYESRTQREVQSRAKERVYTSQHAVRSQQYAPSYRHKEQPRDVRSPSQNGEDYWSQSSNKHVTSPTTHNGQYLPGPPKPPRRQQSLNRIHIISGPNYDEDPKSPSDMEYYTSPESGSPKHWQTQSSNLIEPQRGFAIVASPTSKTSPQDHGYTVQMVERKQKPAEDVMYNRPVGKPPTNKYPQQSYDRKSSRARSATPSKTATSPPPRQSNIPRQASMPVSRNPPQSLPRKQNVQRSYSLTGSSDHFEPLAHSTNSSQRQVANKGVHDSHSLPRHAEPSRRSVGDHQNSQSPGRPIQAGKVQARRSQEKPKQRKISSPDQGVFEASRSSDRRNSAPTINAERLVVQNNQAALHASPQYEMHSAQATSPTNTDHKSRLGALLLSDRDHKRVNTEPWQASNNNDHFSKPEYISDSGISSLRDFSAKPRTKPFEMAKQTLTTSSWNKHHPNKPGTPFNEDTAHYKLYGDGPVAYSSYGNDREQKPSFERRSSADRLSESRPSPVSYSSSSTDRKRPVQPRQPFARRKLLRSSSQESSDPEWNSHSSSFQFSPTSIHPSSSGGWQQGSVSDRSPQKTKFDSSEVEWQQYTAGEVSSPEYSSQLSHYDFPRKQSSDLDSASKPALNDDRSSGNGLRIRASSNRYTATMVEADRIGLEPAVDGGEAYWGMESRKQTPKFAYQSGSPDKIPNSYASKDSTLERQRNTSEYYEIDNQLNISSPPVTPFRENQVHKSDPDQTSSATAERQSRFDRLKHRARAQQREQSFEGDRNTKPRSKSLTRLDNRDRVLKSEELSQNIQSKSTDDLEELKKKGVSRGAALFIKMMRQASEESDHDTRIIEPVSIDSYVGSPQLFQPQLTKTGEPIFRHKGVLSSPDSNSESLYSDPQAKQSHLREEPLVEAQVRSTVAASPPQAKTSESAQIPTTYYYSKGRNKEQHEQDRLKRTPIIDKLPTSPSKFKFDSEPHGKSAAPAEWLEKHETFKHTSESTVARNYIGGNVRKHKALSSPSVDSNESSPTKSKIHSTRHENRSNQKESLMEQEKPKSTPKAGMVPSSPTKLKSPDSEPLPTVRRGRQEVPLEWVEVLKRLRGKPKSQSSGSSGYPSPPGRQLKDNRVSADFEDALSELEHMYSVLDREADDLFLKNYKPFEKRISELPPALQKRLRDLKEFAVSQRTKRRARRERAKSDLALKSKAVASEMPASEARKKQNVPSYHTLGSSGKLTKPTSLNLPDKINDPRQRPHHSPRDESSSDEDTTSTQHLTSHIYRRPRSSDNLGYSSDSSPDLSHKFLTRSDSNKSAVPRKPESRFEAITGLTQPESKQGDKGKTERAINDSKNIKVEQSVTKTSAVDTKLTPGSRVSIESVSTIDSFQLSQPFEDMSSEYHHILTDHRMDLASEEDLSPSQLSSSMESLVQSVASPGSSRLKTKPEKSVVKKGKTSQAVDGPRDGSVEANRNSPAPVPLASFDDEQDLDIPDPTLYTPEGQEKRPHTAQEPKTERKFKATPHQSIKTNALIGSQSSKTVRPVAKLRERYSSTTPTKTETSADKFQRFIEKSDSLHSSDSDGTKRPPAKDCGMSGRSRPIRSANTHDASSPRTSEGAKRGHDTATKRGGADSRNGRGVEGHKVDSVSSRYTKPPRHDKEKVDSIRDEYLSSKSANGEVTRVPRYSRARASGETTTDGATVKSSVTETMSRVQTSSDSSEDPEVRKARIAKYKEQRRRELAERYGLKDGSTTTASSDSDPPASRYKRERKTRNEESTSHIPRRLPDAQAETQRKLAHDSSLPSSPRSPRNIQESASTRSRRDYQSPAKDSLPDSEIASRQRSDSVSSTSSETRTRKDSVISVETQQLVDTLEASRAARRERMRRSVSDVSMDATEKIIAKHRARKSSITSEDGDVFTSSIRKTDDVTIQPSHLPTLEVAPRSRISDTDSPSSSSTSGERLRSRSEPIDPSTLSVYPQQRRAVPDEHKPSSEKGVSTKQSRSRSRRQNVSITAAQIKEASAIGQKMVERKLSLTGSPQPLSSPSTSDSSDTNKKEPSSATPLVSSHYVPSQTTDLQVPLAASKTDKHVPDSAPKKSPKSESPPAAESAQTKQSSDSVHVSKAEKTSLAGNGLEKRVLDSTENKQKVSPDKSPKREVSERAATKGSPRVKSPEKLEGTKRATRETSPEKKLNKSPEKSTKGVQRPQTMSSADCDMGSPSKVRLKRPEIPQLLNEVRKRRNSNESNSSLSEGTLSPTRSLPKGKSSDLDSRTSPASSPVHKPNRISSRLQELAKPRRVEAKKEPMQNGDAKKPERKTPTSPEKKMKARADVAIHSKPENGVIIERNKGRDSPKLKEPKENSISAKITQKPPTSREKLASQSKSQVIPKQISKTEVKQVKPSRDPPKVASKVNARNTSKEISSRNKKLPDSHKQTDVKKAALATKDKDLIAMMRARALSLKDSDDEEESNLEPQTENLEQKPEDVIKVPVAQRLQVFRCAEKLDAKPPMPPISPGSPKSPKSPRLPGSLQIKPDAIEAESHRPETPKTSEAEAESEPDELARLSVSEKKQMFTQISEQKDKEAAKAKPRRSFHRLRQSERSQTQPVTPEEFNSASSLAVASQDSETKELTIDEDDVSRLSLAEKMKLFHQKAKQEQPLPKAEVPKRKRRLNSRFSTQPITVDEVKKAAGINPLARSFTRPPDEVAGLPIAEQIALVYGSQEKLERKNSLSSEKSPSRRQSVTSSPDKKGILKEPSLEKTDSSSDEPPKSILKSDAEIGQDLPQKGRSILKSEDANVVHSDPEVRSILKESKTSDTEETKSILRRDSKQEKDDACSDLSEKSILKKDSTADKPLPASIITCKKTSNTVTDCDCGPERDLERPKDSPRKMALKKEDSQDADVDSGTDDPVRKKTGLATEQLRVRKGRPLITDGCSSSDSETEVRARAKSSPIVEIRTVKKKQVPELDITKKRLKPPTTKDRKERTHSPRRLRSPEPGRFRTQPVTPQEMAQVQQLAEPVKTAGSIAERLSALQKNGQEGWTKRINKYNDSPRTKLKDYLEVPGKDYCTTNAEEDVDLATCSISKRLELIQNSQSSWKKRVEEKDVTQFTVTGKMTKAGKEVVETSPQLRRAGSGRIKRGGSFKGRITLGDKKGGDKTDGEKKENGNTTETKDDKSQETSSSSTVSAKKETSSTTESDSDSCFRIVKKKVAVMKPDGKTFTEFFTSSSAIITEAGIIPKDRKMSLDDTVLPDFDDLSDSHLPKLTALSRNRMSLRPKRRPHGTKNPIRALRTRSNLVTEYEETRKEMVETKAPDRDAIMKSKRIELSSKVNLHLSARRGLASKEDIAKGLQKLQKVKDVREMEGKLSQLLPYKDLMLLHIKGRRFVQVRLVEPSAKMLNTGDCFVLVTPKECFLWIGEYSNVIERSKASEISQHIQTTRDLGCKAPSVVTIEETKGKPLGSTRNWKKVMELLGGAEDVQDIGGADEDELHEIYITETNMVYKVEGDSLVPYDDYWGAPPKFAMLKSNEILVFDFGSELYVWQGKQTSSKERQTAAKLAQIIWERGYDYQEFDINPIWPGQSKKPQHDVDRPDWALFGKTTEHMETVLFQNKFIDWPSVKLKNGEDEQKTEAAPDLVPYDACKMIEPSEEKVDLFLENTNIGRGRGNNAAKSTSEIAHFEKIDQRGNEIVTLSVVVWHVLEYEHSTLPKESFGQFHEGDTYVVRWQYRVESTGMRDLKGNLSKRGQGRGRERCVYFFWQGHCSTINEKGASALMTVELDEERGPQRQVIQGKEPPAFLQLFDGRMVIHIGKREEEKTNTPGPNRLYCVRSEHTEEGLLVETDCSTNELRSRTSFLLVQRQDNINKATICVWHGAKSSKSTRAVAKHAADMLKENKPLETGMKSDCRVTVEEMEEGHETSSFRKILSLDRSAYDSAIKDSLEYNYTPRLFHLTSKSGVFVANEIFNQSRSDIITPFPFEQTELYSASQPAQFLFDNHFEVYLWQGWWPEDQDKRTGSAKMRWDVDSRCAMETVMAYCKEKRIKNPPKAYIVYAGMEPLTFTNLFPWWTVHNDVAEINKKEGKTGDRAVLVSEVLAKLSKAQYTFAELQERPLPDGVDPLKLETYLSQEEFQEKLNMDKEEFYKIPAWKQLKMKKEVGLF